MPDEKKTKKKSEEKPRKESEEVIQNEIEESTQNKKESEQQSAPIPREIQGETTITQEEAGDDDFDFEGIEKITLLNRNDNTVQNKESTNAVDEESIESTERAEIAIEEQENNTAKTSSIFSIFSSKKKNNESSAISSQPKEERPQSNSQSQNTQESQKTRDLQKAVETPSRTPKISELWQANQASAAAASTTEASSSTRQSFPSNNKEVAPIKTSKSKIERCMLCGLCNAQDPILAVGKKETTSTRYKAFLAKRGETNKVFYLSSDVGLCEIACPAGIDLSEAFREARERNVKAGVVTDANEAMLAAFRKTGFPYASMNSEDFRDKPVW